MASADRAPKPMLEHALEYLSRGFPVFPVCSPLMGVHEHWSQEHKQMEPCPGERWGKIPMGPWRAYQGRLPTVAEVRKAWATWPLANIGMATGRQSGVVVLDCDSGSARALAMDKGGLDKTPSVWTGKPGGIHYWLQHPGIDVRNFVAGRKRNQHPGLDFRGDGGYVLLPPSVHRNHNAKYRWNENTVGMTPSEVPPWLLTLLTETDDALEDGPRSIPNISDGLDVEAMLGGFDEGGRDDGLFRLACRFRHDNQPQAYAEALIRVAAQNCRPAFDQDAAVEKVRRAYREYEPPVDYGTWLDELEDGPLQVAGTEPDPQPAPAVTRFLRPISELLAMPEVPPNWMVDQLFTVGSSGWIGAEPKVGKSWTVLELLYCLTTGTRFLGRFDIPQPRRAVYIQEEDSLQRVLRRFKQLIRGTPGRLPPNDDYLKWSIGVGFRLDSISWVALLRAEIEEFRPEVVFLDVFQRLHLKNENDQAEMSTLLAQLTALTREFGCSFILVHHNRKPQSGNEARPNQSLRGSGVLAGWSECSLYLRKGKKKGAFIVVPESKDASEIDDFSVTLVDTDNGGVVLEIGEVGIADRLADTQTKIVEAIEALTREGLDATTQRIADKIGVDRSGVSRYLKDLVDNGTVKEDEVKIGRTYAKFFTL